MHEAIAEQTRGLMLKLSKVSRLAAEEWPAWYWDLPKPSPPQVQKCDAGQHLLTR